MKRRTVGWKKCVTDDNHVETRVKKYFNTGEVTERVPEKLENMCPPLARRVNQMRNLDPQGSERSGFRMFPKQQSWLSSAMTSSW
jgi:hypothetical protein